MEGFGRKGRVEVGSSGETSRVVRGWNWVIIDGPGRFGGGGD